LRSRVHVDAGPAIEKKKAEEKSGTGALLKIAPVPLSANF
jgi:hypothetical protein